MYVKYPDPEADKAHVIACARSCVSRTEFQKRFRNEYFRALRKGYLEEACAEMPRLGSRYERFVYAIFFENTVYVGLTSNPPLRLIQHARYGQNEVRELIAKGAEMVILTALLPSLEASRRERCEIHRYLEAGYVVLNKRVGGSLGGNAGKWTRDRISSEAKLYRTRNEFRSKSAGAYDAARNLGILDEVCLHMPTLPKWDRQKVLTAASRCLTRKEFKKEHSRAYEAARYLKILKELRFAGDLS